MLTGRDKVRAIALEAQRRGTSYGKLAGSLGPREAEEIYARYEGKGPKQKE